MEKGSEEMRIKEVSRLTGLTQKTIRYYETRELIAPRTEDKNGRRFRDYSENNVDELTNIAALRRAMFTVEEIHTMKTEPERIGELVEEYHGRMTQTAENAAILAEASGRLPAESLTDYKALAAGLERTAKQITVKREITPHFGRFDPEEQKEGNGMSKKKKSTEAVLQTRQGKDIAIVFYNMTAVGQKTASTRSEAAGIDMNIVQKLGVLNALRDEVKNEKDNEKNRD